MVYDLIHAINTNDLPALKSLISQNIALKIPNKESIFDYHDVIQVLTKHRPLDNLKQYDFLSYTIVEFDLHNYTYIAKIKSKHGLIHQIYVEEKKETKRLCIRYAYNGTMFYGSQRLSSRPTVTGVLESVLSQYLNHPCDLIPASRTDRFVHAKDQVAHVDTTSNIPIDKLVTILNQALSQDIHIKSIVVVPQVFHARFDVISKTYIYKFVHNKNPDYAHLAVYHKPFDLDKLREKMELFKGKHDFKSFSKSDFNDMTIRTIYEVEITHDSIYTTIRLKGDGFLRYMIRMMIGQVLYDLDYGKDTIQDYIDHPKHDQAIHIASAKGLYLEEIIYE